MKSNNALRLEIATEIRKLYLFLFNIYMLENWWNFPHLHSHTLKESDSHSQIKRTQRERQRRGKSKKNSFLLVFLFFVLALELTGICGYIYFTKQSLGLTPNTFIF